VIRHPEKIANGDWLRPRCLSPFAIFSGLSIFSLPAKVKQRGFPLSPFAIFSLKGEGKTARFHQMEPAFTV
jgi:hypothetical protein